jgi:hypothetical protein
MYGTMRNSYKTSVKKPEGKIPLTRPGYRWDDNAKIYIWNKDCEYVSGINWLMMGSFEHAEFFHHNLRPSQVLPDYMVQHPTRQPSSYLLP